MMGYEHFIARRYLGGGKLFISVATWITILGVTLGVGVVCFVMSMHNGFRTEIRNRLLGTTSDISIFPTGGGLLTNYMDVVSQVEQIDNVEAASPFIYYKAAISSDAEGDGIIVRGVVPELERKTSTIAENIKFGKYEMDSIVVEDADGTPDTIPGMVLGVHLANRLQVFLGQHVVLYSLKGEDLTSKSRPRVAKFYVSGIFETGLYEFDAQLAYISLSSAQRLFRTGDASTAVHLKLSDIYLAQAMSPVIDSAMGYRYDVVPWNELHKNIFSWIEFEKKVLFIGFILIVLVAAFSIISTLVMVTMEKRSEIGILKTIGSTPGAIRKIFLFNGLIIGVFGVVAGWLLAYLASVVQNHYQLIALDPEIYFISYLPMEPHVLDFIGTGAVTFVICLLAAWYPAHQAARVSVIEVLRK